MPAEVKKDDCTGCGACVDACPVDAIKLEDNIAVVDADECTECGVCEDECPTEAITVS